MANKGPADDSSLDPIRTNPSSQGYKHASGLCQNRVESTMTKALVFEVTNAPTHTTVGIVADPTPGVGVHNLVSEPICTPLRLQNFATGQTFSGGLTSPQNGMAKAFSYKTTGHHLHGFTSLQTHPER